MAIHNTKLSMVHESLREMIQVARYCIDFKKSESQNWIGCNGCYGYPGALLLLSIVDALGTQIMGGGDDTKKHFEVLNHPDYFDMKLQPEETEALRCEYRNYLSHNSHISDYVAMSPGGESLRILENYNGILVLNLQPFLILSEEVVSKFIGE